MINDDLKNFEVGMYVGFWFKQRWHIRRADDGPGMHGHQRVQQKVGTVWKCLEMPLSHCWRSGLCEIHIYLPETLEASFV